MEASKYSGGLGLGEKRCRGWVTVYMLLIYNKEIPASASDNTALTDTNGLLSNIMTGYDKK